MTVQLSLIDVNDWVLLFAADGFSEAIYSTIYLRSSLAGGDQINRRSMC
jgi:hypothetical protein